MTVRLVWAGEGAVTVWVVTAPMVCPLSATMSSVPEDNKFIVQVAVVWKSGWAKIDWNIDFVVHQYGL